MATTNKYDRQLRLWGANGQKCLMETHICVLGSSGLATEFLKNMVLPGIGQFTIIDDVPVTERDFGNNFFVNREDLGRQRAEVSCRLLCELNPDVAGTFTISNPWRIIVETPQDLGAFDLIVGTQLTFKESMGLSRVCESIGKRLILLRTIGLFSHLRLYVPEHLVVEGKTADTEIFDLRIHRPFEELSHFALGVNLTALDDKVHQHTPFVVLLLKFINEWKVLKGRVPASFQEKTEFKEFIKSKSRNFFTEMNFREAVERSYLAYPEEELPYEATQVLNDQKSSAADAMSPLFWRCARAVKQFSISNGVLPVTGMFPDMTSESSTYMKLQGIYKEKATRDYEAVLGTVHSLSQGNLSESDVEFVRIFCRNLPFIQIFRYSTYHNELENPNVEELSSALYDENPLLDWYVSYTAYLLYHDQFRDYPQSHNLMIYNEIASNVVAKLRVDGVQVSDPVQKEFIRYNNSEIHCTAAFLGGVAAQEAVKLITAQYTPVNNTFLHTFTSGAAQVLTI